jgi:multiple sugar transport system substrate-binding protein
MRRTSIAHAAHTNRGRPVGPARKRVSALLVVASILAACGGSATRSGSPAVASGSPPAAGTPSASAPVEPVSLRLQVSLTPEELASFRPAIAQLDATHPEWIIELEEVPQGGEVERVTSSLAAGDLPDVLRLTGINVQQWIRRNAFTDLTDPVAAAGLDLEDFYPGPVDQFRWNDGLWGLPDTASPELVYFDRAAFTAAGLDPPTNDWTYDDMRAAALALTTDGEGRHPGDADFDPGAVERWGWNGGVTYFWQNPFIKALGGDLCANPDCTEMRFTGEANERAFEWWVTLVRDDGAALYDPYGGSQTGTPGDPFISGRAAMGSNGSFAIGQLNAAGTIDYDVIPPLVGTGGERYTPLSTNGYLIAADNPNQDQAWALVQALVAEDFLASTWGRPGHGVPARRSAAASIVNEDHPPDNQAAILEAMEVGEVFRPYTANAGAAYGATVDLFRRMNTGELSIPDALAQIEAAANTALAPDRAP